MKFKNIFLDKFEAYMPNQPNWIHDDCMVSCDSREFHLSSGFISFADGSRPGTMFGVNRKLTKASGYGIFIDSARIGKTDTR